MKILYLNYMGTALPTLIRSFELARATSSLGHEVTLCFMSRHFRPPAFFLDLLRSSESPRFRILHSAPDTPANPPASFGPGATSVRAGPGRPTLKGLAKQIAGSLLHLPMESRLIAEIRPDVIVARPDHIISIPITARRYGVPLVLETDGPVEELDHYWGISSRWVRPLDTARARRAQALLVISRVCEELWLRKGIPASRLFLCPNGADPEVFRPSPPAERQDTRRRLGLDGSLVIGFSGNQRRWHGVDRLLRAAVPLLREQPALKLLIIGALQEASLLELDHVPSALREGRIVRSGAVPYSEMPRLIDAADLMVLPYPDLPLFHFSPMKMFEALAMAKPLVASRQGQIADVLADLESCYLFDPDTPEALEHSLRRAVADVSAGRGGDAGRRLLERAHTWAHRGGVIAEACSFARRAAGLPEEPAGTPA